MIAAISTLARISQCHNGGMAAADTQDISARASRLNTRVSKATRATTDNAAQACGKRLSRPRSWHTSAAEVSAIH